MGKALVFNGLIVENPLRVVTFAPNTPTEYVSYYSSIVTEVTTEQKEYLISFVQTLMYNGLWDYVRDFFPMLGGVDFYNTSLKRPLLSPVWNSPASGTTWDSIRNAPRLILAGEATGTPLAYSGYEKFDPSSATMLFAFKLAAHTRHYLLRDYAYNGGVTDSFMGDFNIENDFTNGSLTISLTEENRISRKNVNGVIGLSCLTDSSILFCGENSGSLLSTTGSPLVSTTGALSFAFGGYFAATAVAPASGTLNGCLNSFILFDKALSESEFTIVYNALNTLNIGLGRNIDFA